MGGQQKIRCEQKWATVSSNKHTVVRYDLAGLGEGGSMERGRGGEKGIGEVGQLERG